MKHTILLLDLDGTTLDSNKNVSKENLEAINEYIAKGGYVCFSSGRNLGNVIEYAKMLHLESAWHIGINGSILMNAETKETIILNKPTEEMYKKGCDYITQNGYSAVAMMPLYVVYYDSKNGKTKWALGENEYNKHGDITNLTDVIKLNIANSNEEEREKHKMYMESLGFKTTISSPYWIECLSPDSDKYTGAVALCKKLGKDISEVCAIGDYENDFALLSQIDYSVCPINATDHIKSICKIILPVSNDESAVSYLIRNYLLKEE